MDIKYVLLVFVILGVLGFAGLLRPTGLAARTSAERDDEARQDMAAKFLERDHE